MKDEIVFDKSVRIIVDLVNKEMPEYRASIYDEDDFLCEGWSDTIRSAIADAWHNHEE